MSELDDLQKYTDRISGEVECLESQRQQINDEISMKRYLLERLYERYHKLPSQNKKAEDKP